MAEPTRQNVAAQIAALTESLWRPNNEYARHGRPAAGTEEDMRAATEPSRAENAKRDTEVAHG